MSLIWSYVRRHRKILILGLFLAAINQFFSLLDPQVLRLMIDKYVTHAGEFSTQEFLHGILYLLLAFVGVAFISRVAKNFQDYFVSMVSQKVGASIYERSIGHSSAGV